MKQIERDKLIDGYFNKGWACDLGEVKNAVFDTIGVLEQANDKKVIEIEKLQQENKQLKDFLGLLEINIRINHDDIQINLYKKLLQIFKDLKDILGDKE